MEDRENGKGQAEAIEQAERELNATLSRADMDNVFSSLILMKVA